MHQSVRDFVASCVFQYDLADMSVLEVGSLNINGSVRNLFTGDYVGIDLCEGRDVDMVADAHTLNGQFQDRQVILCLEMLEHDDAPWVSLAQMRHTVAADGFLVLTARGYGEHGCYQVHDRCWNDDGTYDIGDFWRFSVSGMVMLLKQTGWDVLYCGPDTDPDRPGVFAVARAAG